MPRLRDEIVRKLWRGEDPFLSPRPADGAPDLQGWGSQHRYLTDAIEALRPSVIVEVGVWKGASVIHMASRLRDLGLDGAVIAVDTWRGAWDHWVKDEWFQELGVLHTDRGIFATFLRNVRSVGLEDYIVPLPLDSINAAQVLRHFNIFPDVLHIDAGHDRAAVLADIRQWWPLLKPGGLLIGDDYRAGNDWPGVKQAFDDYFLPLGLTPLENTNEKCRVSKPGTVARTSNLLSAMTQTGVVVSKWREACRLEMVRLIEGERLSAEEQLEGYIRFSGPSWPGSLNKIRDQIARKLNLGGRGDVFGPLGEIKGAVVQAAIPSFDGDYPDPVQIEGIERFELLPESENRFARSALPPPFNVNMGKSKAPALVAYRIPATDLFLTPLGYQLFRAADGTYWPAVSTRAYPQEAMGCPNTVVTQPVVVVQDSFEGSNFSHFLFDWVPRLVLFLSAGIENPESCLFVMGGAPVEFHFHVIQAICEIYSLDPAQFVFPREPQIWRIKGSIYVFSDFKDDNMHPANMAHRQSVAIVREICSRIQTPPGELKRIYISRGDTPLRNVANESELMRQLKSFGFVEVQLARLPFLDQTKIVRGAEVIVAPHGMGLAHLVFHQGQPLIVELHNAAIGTDAYAFLSHALGFKYRIVLGTDLGGSTHHFNIVPQDVINILLEEGVSPVVPVGISRTHQRFMGGVQSVKASEVFNIRPPRSNAAVYRHTRDALTVQPDNNTGWLEVSGLIDGAVYHCSCDLWIPSDFKGTKVAFDCSGLAAQHARPAELTKTEQWQTISISGTAAEPLVNFVLRCDADADGIFYSSEWRPGPGIHNS